MKIVKEYRNTLRLQNRLGYIYISFCMAILLGSCVKDVDFDQVETLTLTPVYDIDFIYADVGIETLITQSDDSSVIIPEATINDTLAYDFLQDDFVTDNITQVVITFEFENTIERGFEFGFQFLNAANESIAQDYTINVLPGMGEDEPPVTTSRDIILDSETIAILGGAERLASSISAQNVSRNLTGGVLLKSKALYFISYQL